jgi:catechol 2,3-dioxygenase-like lactoylglutathione lyase family enzyme
VEDLLRSRLFYQDTFGLSAVYEDENSTAFDFGNTLGGSVHDGAGVGPTGVVGVGELAAEEPADHALAAMGALLPADLRHEPHEVVVLTLAA